MEKGKKGVAVIICSIFNFTPRPIEKRVTVITDPSAASTPGTVTPPLLSRTGLLYGLISPSVFSHNFKMQGVKNSVIGDDEARLIIMICCTKPQYGTLQGPKIKK